MRGTVALGSPVTPGIVGTNMHAEIKHAKVVDSIPAWSGDFVEFKGEGVAMMMVSNHDERQHRPPPGWEPIHHSTADNGEFEVYTFRKSEDW